MKLGGFYFDLIVICSQSISIFVVILGKKIKGVWLSLYGNTFEKMRFENLKK